MVVVIGVEEGELFLTRRGRHQLSRSNGPINNGRRVPEVAAFEELIHLFETLMLHEDLGARYLASRRWLNPPRCVLSNLLVSPSLSQQKNSAGVQTPISIADESDCGPYQ